MEVLINSKTAVSHEIEIIVPYEELRPHFDKAYREEAKNIVIPGFRRGRVPLQIIKKRFGDAIEYQVIEKVSNEFFREAMEERDIKPIGQPVLHDLDYKPGEQLTMKVAYETEPEVLASNYKGLQLERLTHEVTDEEVDDEIQGLLKSQRTLDAVEQADDENHLVTIDIQMLDEDGKPKAGQRNENMKVDLDDENMSRDLIAELYNMKAGEEKDVELTHQHGDHEHIERAHIRVKSVERTTMPELDDAFAERVSNGDVKTVPELRRFIHTRLEELWENRYRQQLDNDLVGEIIKRNPFAVPESMIDSILDEWVKQLQERQPGKELPPDFDAEEYRKGRRQEAEYTAKWMFLRDSIIEQEGIKLEDADVEEKAARDSEAMGIDKERLIEFYKSSPQYTQTILMEKLMNFLHSESEIKDIDDNDISKTGMSPLSFKEEEPESEPRNADS
ncbi:MAG: trigger factor [Bacteroidetes bacterium]|nr:trigger factor [Bacteroidota bacterium]